MGSRHIAKQKTKGAGKRLTPIEPEGHRQGAGYFSTPAVVLVASPSAAALSEHWENPQEPGLGCHIAVPKEMHAPQEVQIFKANSHLTFIIHPEETQF